MSRTLGVVIWLLIALAAALRVPGVYDDFWLDEIWSWRLAAQIPGDRPWQVLTHPLARYDNNHPLNTLYIGWVGRTTGWPAFRVPPLLAGIGTVILAAIILRRRGLVEALVGVILLGFSYPLLFFSSEARGYAPAVFFAFLAFDAIERFLMQPRGWRGWAANGVFVAACVVGVLSHLTFVHFYAGVLTWSLYRWVRSGRGIAASIRFHTIPIAVIVALYFVFVRHLTIGGAPAEKAWEAMVRSIGALLGAVEVDIPIAIVTIAGGALLFIVSLIHLHRTRNDLWILLLVSVLISPLLVLGRQLLLAEQRQPIAARYFLVPYAMLLLGMALLLGDWLRRRDARRVLAGAILIAFLAVNLRHTARFIQIGRGHYLDAVAYMSQRTPQHDITVLSDHPWRTAMVLEYYQPFLSPHQQLIIYDGSAPPVQYTHGLPLWLIVHSNVRDQPPARAIGLEGEAYAFDREFTYFGLSGYSWYLYRHEAIPPESP